jgi:membrane protein YqaA with SNARE-associated domain
MTKLFHSMFGFFLTWWGAYLLGAIDSSLLFMVPFGNDALVVYLVARDRGLFWLYPLITTAGSVTGAAFTYWLGKKAGESGLERFVPARRLADVKSRVRSAGAIAMALPAVLPPPFPLTPFVLTCGALEVNAPRFFSVFAAARLIRFGTEAILARRYGNGVLDLLMSDAVQLVIVGLIVLAVGGTIVSGILLWRRTRTATSLG